MASRRSRSFAPWLTAVLAALLLLLGLPGTASAEDPPPPPRLNFVFGDCVADTEASYINYNSSNWKPGTTATLEYGGSTDTVTVPGDGILDAEGLGELFNNVWPTTLKITGTGLDDTTYIVESASIPDPGCGRRFTTIESYCDIHLGEAIRFTTDGWDVVDDFYQVTIAGETYASDQPNGVYRNAVWPTTVFILAEQPTYPDLDDLESGPLADPGPCSPSGYFGLDKLTAGDRSKDASFGAASAISGDYAVVGAPGGGGAYVFKRNGDTWQEQTKLIPFDGAGNLFGTSVAIEGTTAVVGAPGSDVDVTDGGAAYVFVLSGSTWIEQGRLTPGDPEANAGFGTSVAIEGNTVIAGAPRMDGGAADSGAAYAFTRTGSTWSQQQKLQGSDTAANGRFGNGVAVSGQTAIVGSPSGNTSRGAAYVFTRSSGSWSQQAKLEDTAANDLGYSVAIDGNVAIVGAPGNYTKIKNRGAAYVFTRNGATWSAPTQWTAGGDGFVGDLFGYGVGVSGDLALVGAPDIRPESGFGYLYERSDSGWTRNQQIESFNGPAPFFFGASVDIEGRQIIIGDSVEGPDAEGAAYTFEADPDGTTPPPPPLMCNGLEATISGTDQADTLTGTPGDDIIAGGGGDDVLMGLTGNDIICGGAGDDEIFGGPGNDTMFGDAGNDLLRGHTGDDVNYGGGGEDRIQDGPGADVLWGGADKDKMWGGNGNDELWGEGGNDQLHGNRDDDVLRGGDGTDRIWGDSGFDTLFGDGRSDFLYGGINDDVLTGGPGNDRLFGWSGEDELYGQGGRDQLRGQDGDDLVNGGAGSDFCSVEPIWINCEIEL